MARVRPRDTTLVLDEVVTRIFSVQTGVDSFNNPVFVDREEKVWARRVDPRPTNALTISRFSLSLVDDNVAYWLVPYNKTGERWATNDRIVDSTGAVFVVRGIGDVDRHWRIQLYTEQR